MSSFEVLHKDVLGRIGKLYTKNGVVETPTLTPVVNPYKNVLEPAEIKSIGFDLVITNAYLIKKHYGEVAVEMGVHSLLGVKGPVMTDSGAYQLLVYGDVEVGPREIFEYQVALGSDIGVILDIPTRLSSPKDRVREEVEETLRRVREALTVDRRGMLLVGPVQGGLYLDLVAHSASALANTDGVDLYAIGGPTQLLENYRFADLVKLVMTAKMYLRPDKPVHLFGAGHPLIIPLIVAMGIDLFDSASYALYARDLRYMTPFKTYRLEELEELPCSCPVCSSIDIGDLKEMPREEVEPLLAKHNLYVLLREIRLTRQAIREGTLWNLLESRAKLHPSLYPAIDMLRKYIHFIEKYHPTTHAKVSAEFFYDAKSRYRPTVYRHFLRLRDRYEPPRRRILVLLPETESKPPTRYGWVKELLAKLESLKEVVHFAVYSAVYGVIPLELDGTYPLSQYEAPNSLVGEVYSEVASDIAWYVRRYYSMYYKAGVVILHYGEYGKVAHAVTSVLRSEGIRCEVLECQLDDLDATANLLRATVKLLLGGSSYA